MKFLLLITSITAASAQLNCGPAGSFTIAGTLNVEPIARAWAEAYVAKCPSTTITVEGGGSSAGARRVCNLTSAGTAVEIGNMSREWLPSEASQTGSPRKFLCNIGTRSRVVTQIDVAVDAITIALINGGLAAQCLRRLPGRGLSNDQLRWIYSNYTKAQLLFSGWDATSIPFDDNNETSHKWSEISGKTLCPLIDGEIKLSAPGSLSRTFDYFKAVVLPNTTEGVATKRPNGIFQSYIDEELVEFVETSSEELYGDAISFFGFSFFINEGQILYGVPIRNKGASAWVTPNVTSIEGGTYVPFSRRIYMNVLDTSLEQTGPYISFGLNQEGIGLVRKVGFLPPPRIELAEILARIGREPPLPIGPTAAPQRPPSIFIPFPVPVAPVPVPVPVPVPIPVPTTIVREEQLRVACNFLGVTDLTVCLATKSIFFRLNRGGRIPTEIGLLTQLQSLVLFLNQLSGTIPTNIGFLTQLTRLDLDSNQLTGTIPTNIGLLTQLNVLDLARNQLTGTIPSNIGLLTQLQDLDLSSNQLSGTIPTNIGLLTQLQFLALFSNQLSGTIPSTLCSAKNVIIDCVNIVCLCCQSDFGMTKCAYKNTINVYHGDDFKVKVESAIPGDTIVVHEGNYSTDDTINISANGTVEIIGACNNTKRPRIFRSSTAAVQSTININIKSSTNITIQGLEIMSNGGDGIKIVSGDGTWNNTYITLEDLEIYNVAVGINVQTNVGRLVVSKSHIFDTFGQGVSLGCPDGTCIVTNSEIVDNWIHDTLSGQGNGIELNKNSSGVIRNNVIYNTNPAGIRVSGAALIEGNVMWKCQEGGIQVAADAIIRNNLVFRSAYGLISRVLNSVNPRNLTIEHNTFLNSCLSIQSWNDRSDIIFANNAVYCSTTGTGSTMSIQGGTQNVQFSGNVFFPDPTIDFPPGSFVVGRGITQDFKAPLVLDAYPTKGSMVRNAANGRHVTAEDFDGTTRVNRLPADAGAYEWTESGRKWTVDEYFKRDDTPSITPECTTTLTRTARPRMSPTISPTNSPTYSPTKSPAKSRCGLLNLRIFCPITFCGLFGRLFGLCSN